MTLVTFLKRPLDGPAASPLTAGSQLLIRLSRLEMDRSTGQQTGWIHLVDLTIAFVIPIYLLKTMCANQNKE